MTCKICGTNINLEKHHLDYIKNITVILCRKHHGQAHGTNLFPDLKAINKNNYGVNSINIDDDLYKRLVAFYDTQDKLEYPTLKNFVSKKIKELINPEVDD